MCSFEAASRDGGRSEVRIRPGMVALGRDPGPWKDGLASTNDDAGRVEWRAGPGGPSMLFAK